MNKIIRSDLNVREFHNIKEDGFMWSIMEPIMSSNKIEDYNFLDVIVIFTPYKKLYMMNRKHCWLWANTITGKMKELSNEKVQKLLDKYSATKCMSVYQERK